MEEKKDFHKPEDFIKYSLAKCRSTNASNYKKTRLGMNL